MKKYSVLKYLCIMFFVFCFNVDVYGEGRILSDFNVDEEGWDIPDWAFDQADYVCKSIKVADKDKKDDNKSLVMEVDFTGQGFCSSIIERKEDLSFEGYKVLSCDIFMEKVSRKGIKARFIIYAGKKWTWIEMYEPVLLVPGKWVTLSADLTENGIWKELKTFPREDTKGNSLSDAYRYVKTPLTQNIKEEIHAIGIRIESNSIRYKGNIYIDNIILEQ